MPSRPCHHPTCTAYVRFPARFCQDHADLERQQEAARREKQAETRAARARSYNRFDRDPEARRFYNSARWERARRKKLTTNPVCQRCNRAWSRHVHHTKPLKECTDAEAVDQRLLRALCVPCHNVEEAELNQAKEAKTP